MVYIVGLFGLLHDKLVARAGVLSHEVAHHSFGFQRIIDEDTLQGTALGQHGRLLELVRTHLPETLEAGNRVLAHLPIELIDDLLLLLVGPGPVLLAPMVDPVKRRHPEIDEASLMSSGR